MPTENDVAVNEFTCTTTSCQEPEHSGCVTATGRPAAKPHAPRLRDARAFIKGATSRQGEVDSLAGQIGTLEGQITGDATELTDLRTQVRDLKAQVAEVDPLYLPDWGGLPAWSTEFDQPDGPLDPATFNTRGPEMGYLEDAAVLDKGQVYVKDKVLHIAGDWLPTPYARPGGVSKWGIDQITHKSGYVDQCARPGTMPKSPGKVIFQAPFLRTEVRFWTPTGANTRGAEAALWWRGVEGVDLRELDLMEAIGWGGLMTGRDGKAKGYESVKNSAKTTVFSNTKTGAEKKQYRWRGTDLSQELNCNVDPSAGWTTLAASLTPDYFAIEVNGTEYGRWTPKQLPQVWGPNAAANPLHLRMNLHVGEYFATPDPAHRELTQPLDLKVDWVRHYALPAVA